ncbi:hypothetical protein OC842_005463 [Tilletia horrida]|uniref:Non-structural maintenance of chromosomes element 4 n=1 Tax=Tilletia horrida TaxID=155126 RepID=A0AAN6GAA2_9BASI|nr:hypothetical protein OC842_005463 [Tilletia horrida]
MPRHANGHADDSQAGPSRSQRSRDEDQAMDVDEVDGGDVPHMSQAKAFAKNAFQDANEKRELRKNYRMLMAAADDARKDIADQTSGSLTNMLKQTDTLFDKVKAPSEGILDARLLGQMVDIGTHLARTLKTNADAFDTDSFLTRVARLMGGQVRAAGRRGGEELDDEEAALAANEWDWDALGRIAARHSRRAVTLDFLHGPLQTKPKERKQTERTKKVKEKVGAAVRPEELKENDIQRSENETTVMVRQIANLLEEVGEVNLFNFVVDPTSFSNTVENLFYVSFLIRDGKVSLETDNEEGEPILMRAEPPREEDYAQGLTKRQIVMEFDMKIYRDIIETYGITESIIPSRKEVKKESQSQSGRWYG